MTFQTIDEASLSEQVNRFYALAKVDPLLGPVQAMVGGRGYGGNPFAKHQDHGIEPAMFDRWLELWGQTAKALFAPELADRLIQRAELIGRSLKSGLFMGPGPTWPDV
jgi:hemoglobin